MPPPQGGICDGLLSSQTRFRKLRFFTTNVLLRKARVSACTVTRKGVVPVVHVRLVGVPGDIAVGIAGKKLAFCRCSSTTRRFTFTRRVQLMEKRMLQ